MRNAACLVCRSACDVTCAFLLALVLAGCGGERASPQRPLPATLNSAMHSDRTAAPRMAAGAGASTTAAPSQAGKAAPLTSPIELARFKTLPLLASLSDRDKAALLKRLAGASPSGRRDVINTYPSLQSLSEPQREGLLKQIDTIVPVSTPASQLVCSCSNDVKRTLCVKEDCANTAALSSLCNQACGTLAAFQAQCHPAPQCRP